MWISTQNESHTCLKQFKPTIFIKKNKPKTRSFFLPELHVSSFFNLPGSPVCPYIHCCQSDPTQEVGMPKSLNLKRDVVPNYTLTERSVMVRSYYILIKSCQQQE